MGVRVVEEVEQSEVLRLPRSIDELQPAREEPRAPKPPPNHREALLDLMFSIAKLMGVRIQLFFVFVGALGLGGWAVYKADPMALTAFGMYAALIWLPMLYVCHRRG